MSQEGTLAIREKETPASIQKSEVLRRGIITKVQQIEASIVTNAFKRAKAASLERDAVKEKVQSRIKENSEASKAAEKCVRSIDDVVKDTALWITKLHHERYKQFAAKQVCERRIELHPAELSKDALQDALEMELKILNQARKEFMGMETEVKQVCADLQSSREILSKDAARRRLNIEADRAILVNVALAASVAPGAKTIPGENEGHVPEPETTLAESKEICKKSLQLEEDAARLRSRAKACISRVRDECNKAIHRVESRLTARTEQTLNVTKQLIGQGKEVDYTILMAQRQLTQNKKNIDPKDRAQCKNYQATLDMVDMLKRSRADLQQDLGHKTLLLRTSESCRKVTPQVAASPGKRPTTAPVPDKTRGRTRTSSNMSKSSSTPVLPQLAGASPPEEYEAPSPKGPASPTSQAFEESFEGGMADSVDAAQMPAAIVE
jgi:hypothetical protein